MLRSMNSAITGLKMHQLYMDVIGNNIANVNTTAFKAGRIMFQNLLSQTIRNSVAPTEARGGINAVQVGMGATVAGVESVNTQGSFTATAKVTDLAIQGDGFFVVSDGFQRFYTRDGAFDLDQNGNLISPNTGLRVVGWMADNGKIDSTRPPTGAITIPVGQAVAAKATTTVELSGNLNGAATHMLKTGIAEYITEAGPGTQPTIGFDINDGDTITFSYDGVTYTTPVGNGAGAGTPPTNGGLGAHVTNSPMSAAATAIQTAMYQALVNAGKFPAGLAAADQPIQVKVVDDGGIQGGEAFFTLEADKALSFGNSPSNNLSLSAILRNRQAAGLEVVTTTVQVYDSLGNAHDITLRFEKVLELPTLDPLLAAPTNYTPGVPTPDLWRWSASGATIDINGTDPTQLAPNNKLGAGFGYVQFDSSGTFRGVDSRWVDANTAPTSEPIAQGSRAIIRFDWNNGSADDQDVIIDFSKLTQLQDGNTVTESRNDGFATGTLLNFIIGADGTIAGQYSNGVSEALAQVALATFPNVAGLTQLGSNMFLESANSGLANIGTPRTAGRGSINAGQLEMSNVDLAQQFTDMIRAQRGFQANSRIITTSDEMLQDLVNLKR